MVAARRVEAGHGSEKRFEESMLKRLCLALAAMVMVCGSALTVAAELKIGFIDAERINKESAPAERASKQLEKEFAPRAQELQRREGRLNLDFQRMQREYREDLNLRRNQELGALFERANRVIRQIAEAEKYDIILQEAVYRNPKIDITDKVLKALADGK